MPPDRSRRRFSPANSSFEVLRNELRSARVEPQMAPSAPHHGERDRERDSTRVLDQLCLPARRTGEGEHTLAEVRSWRAACAHHEITAVSPASASHTQLLGAGLLGASSRRGSSSCSSRRAAPLDAELLSDVQPSAVVADERESRSAGAALFCAEVVHDTDRPVSFPAREHESELRDRNVRHGVERRPQRQVPRDRDLADEVDRDLASAAARRGRAVCAPGCRRSTPDLVSGSRSNGVTAVPVPTGLVHLSAGELLDRARSSAVDDVEPRVERLRQRHFHRLEVALTGVCIERHRQRRALVRSVLPLAPTWSVIFGRIGKRAQSPTWKRELTSDAMPICDVIRAEDAPLPGSWSD